MRFAIIALGLLLLAGIAIFFLKKEQANTGLSQAPTTLPDFNVTKLDAEKGDSAAQNALGEIYAEGKQVRQDYAEAARWYRKAADQGFAKAEFNLASLYDIGQGLPQVESEAAKWYRKAAEKGNADAQYSLASMLGLGRAVPRNPKEALSWYERAAEQGDALASYNLAERYERGKDVAQDFVEAYKWHSLAADRGLKDATEARISLEKRLTRGQITEARTRIREFKEKHPSKPSAK